MLAIGNFFLCNKKESDQFCGKKGNIDQKYETFFCLAGKRTRGSKTNNCETNFCLTGEAMREGASVPGDGEDRRVACVRAKGESGIVFG